MPGERVLPVAPLLPHIERAVERRAFRLHDDRREGSHRWFCEDVAERLGVSPASVARQLVRWRKPGVVIEHVVADRWAIALGLHPALVWGESWWELLDASPAATRRAEMRLELEADVELATAAAGGA